MERSPWSLRLNFIGCPRNFCHALAYEALSVTSLSEPWTIDKAPVDPELRLNNLRVDLHSLHTSPRLDDVTSPALSPAQGYQKSSNPTICLKLRLRSLDICCVLDSESGNVNSLIIYLREAGRTGTACICYIRAPSSWRVRWSVIACLLLLPGVPP